MNILLINHYAGSIRHGMEYRPYYLAREWVRMGHTVTIAAASVSHLRSAPPEIRGTITREIIDGITYVWFKTPSYKGNGALRAVNIFSFVGQLLWNQRWLACEFRPDLVIASSTYPLDVLAAQAIAHRSNARLIFEVHDLWPLSPIELGGMSKHHPFILMMQWAENYAYRSADWVVSILPWAEEHMREHGMRPGRFVHIPNGIDVEEWNEGSAMLPEEHARAIAECKAQGRTIVGYAGAHGLANALEALVETAELLRSMPLAFVLVGQGQGKEELKQLAARRGLVNVIFLPPVLKDVIPSLLREMDILYIGWRQDLLIYRFGISANKLLDYMMSGRPIVHAVRAANDPVAESGCGISVAPEDAPAIAAAVQKLAAMSVEERNVIGQRGQARVVENHDYRVLAKKFLEAIDNQNKTYA